MEKKKKKRLLIIIISVLILAIVACTLYFTVFKKKPNQDELNASQTSSGEHITNIINSDLQNKNLTATFVNGSYKMTSIFDLEFCFVSSSCPNGVTYEEVSNELKRKGVTNTREYKLKLQEYELAQANANKEIFSFVKSSIVDSSRQYGIFSVSTTKTAKTYSFYGNNSLVTVVDEDGFVIYTITPNQNDSTKIYVTKDVYGTNDSTKKWYTITYVYENISSGNNPTKPTDKPNSGF